MNDTLPQLQPIDWDANSAVSRYLKASATVCPFIEPAAQAKCLFTSEVVPDCRTTQDIYPRLFEQLVPSIERFRDMRKALPEKQLRLLICHLIVIQVATHFDEDAVRLLNWPNWLAVVLKKLYTPKEIIFGLVRKNVVEKSVFGGVVPTSPFHALVIRSRVVGSDGRFFAGNEPMLQAMMQADDDDRDACAAVPGEVPDIRSQQALREAGYFQRVQRWAQQDLAEQNHPTG